MMESLVVLAGCGAAPTSAQASSSQSKTQQQQQQSSSQTSGRDVTGAGIAVFKASASADSVASFRDCATVANGLAVVRRQVGANGDGGDMVASVQDSHKKCVKLFAWKKEQASLVCTSPEKLGPICATSCGEYVFAGGQSGACYVWEVASGALLRTWTAHYRAVTCLRFIQDDSRLLSAGKDAIVHAWDLADILDMGMGMGAGAARVRPSVTLSDHALPVTDLWTCGFGLGSHVLSCSQDATLKLWALKKTNNLLHTVVLPCPLSCVVSDSLESTAFVGGQNGTIYECPLRSDLARPVIADDPRQAPATHLGAKRRRTSAPGQGQGRGQGKGRQQEQEEQDMHDRQGGRALRALRGHDGAVTCVALTTSGLLLISGSVDGTCRVWDTNAGLAVKVVKVSSGVRLRPVVSLVLAPMPSALSRGRGERGSGSGSGSGSAAKRGGERVASAPAMRPLLRYQSTAEQLASDADVLLFRTCARSAASSQTAAARKLALRARSLANSNSNSNINSNGSSHGSGATGPTSVAASVALPAPVQATAATAAPVAPVAAKNGGEDGDEEAHVLHGHVKRLESERDRWKASSSKLYSLAVDKFLHAFPN